MNQQGFDASAGVGSLSKLAAHFDRTKLLNPETGEYEYQRYPSLTVRGRKRSVDYSEIDPERTHLNYNLAAEDQPLGQLEFLEKRLGEIYAHKRALQNALLDWVVTLPDMEQYKGREREFFQTVYDAMCEKYGRENVVSAYVHMDEVQPHMHFAFVPVVRDEKHPQGWKLSRKAVNTCERTVKDKETGRQVVKRDTREFSKQMHELVENRVCEEMGFKQAGVILTKEQAEKRTIKENMRGPAELKQATERLECLQGEIAEVEPAAVTLGESVRALWEARSDGGREEQLASEVDGLRSRISELEGANQRARERVAELDRGLPGLRGRYQQLEQRFEAVAGRVRQAIERLREVPETVSAWALDIAHKLGKRTYDPNSLDYMKRQAIEAARGISSARGWEPRQNRNWSR